MNIRWIQKKKIEELKPRRSRVRIASSSEDEEEVEAPVNGNDEVEKSDDEEQNGHEEESMEVEEEEEVVIEKPNRKRKLDQSMNESIQLTKKKLKLADEEKKTEKVAKEPVDLASIVSKCTEYMETFNEKKKKSLNVKRTLKAEKLSKKKMENAKDQEDDSSKENIDSLKKKKKKYRNKIKKQKTVEGKIKIIVETLNNNLNFL
jgi:hypothetical protein